MDRNGGSGWEGTMKEEQVLFEVSRRNVTAFLKLSVKQGLAMLGYGIKASWNPIHIWQRKMRIYQKGTGLTVGYMTALEATNFALKELKKIRAQVATIFLDVAPPSSINSDASRFADYSPHLPLTTTTASRKCNRHGWWRFAGPSAFGPADRAATF